MGGFLRLCFYFHLLCFTFLIRLDRQVDQNSISMKYIETTALKAIFVTEAEFREVRVPFPIQKWGTYTVASDHVQIIAWKAAGVSIDIHNLNIRAFEVLCLFCAYWYFTSCCSMLPGIHEVQVLLTLDSRTVTAIRQCEIDVSSRRLAVFWNTTTLLFIFFIKVLFLLPEIGRQVFYSCSKTTWLALSTGCISVSRMQCPKSFTLSEQKTNDAHV